MDPPIKLKFSEYTFNALCILLPWLMCLPIIPKLKAMGPSKRYLIAILVTWLALFLFNDFYYLRARLQYADYRGNHSYDGTAMNGIILLFGWIIPLITALPAVLLASFLYKRKTQDKVAIIPTNN